MRIAYIARWDVGHESGILKKMASQLRRWRASGHEVRLFAITPSHDLWPGIADLPVTPFFGDDLWTRITRHRTLSDPILSWRPDVCYLRFSTYYPALERVVSKVPTVVEINGDDIAENRLSLPYPLYVAHRITRARLLSRARGMVYVTHELARNPRYVGFGMPGLVVANGIDLDSHPELPHPPLSTAPSLVFVGYANCAWHGEDKLTALARAEPEWRIDVVGTDRSTRSSPSPKNLHYHGHLERIAYEALLRQADVAIGTLALHRKQMHEASPLKTREYLAFGIPTIIGYRDTDFLEPHPLILELPNTEQNIAENLPRIREFVERVRGRRVPRRDVAHLDWRAKEESRLSFIEMCARPVSAV